MARGPQMKQVMEANGIGDDTLVIAYDDEGGHAASRLWLAMLVHGHGGDIRILEGGLTKWQQEGRPLSTEPANSAATFTPREGPADILRDRRAGAGGDLRSERRWSSTFAVHTELHGRGGARGRGGRVPGRRPHALAGCARLGRRPRVQVGRRGARAACRRSASPPRSGRSPTARGRSGRRHGAGPAGCSATRTSRCTTAPWEDWGNRPTCPSSQG